MLSIAAGYQISIHTDEMVMMAAGYLEGALTNKYSNLRVCGVRKKCLFLI